MKPLTHCPFCHQQLICPETKIDDQVIILDKWLLQCPVSLSREICESSFKQVTEPNNLDKIDYLSFYLRPQFYVQSCFKEDRIGSYGTRLYPTDGDNLLYQGVVVIHHPIVFDFKNIDELRDKIKILATFS